MFKLKLFAIVLPVFLALDFFWIGWLMADFYKREMWSLARKSGDSLAPIWPAAILVYVAIPLGLVLFVQPLIANGGIVQAILWGATFGLVVYAVYDCTNLALLAGWSVRVTAIDIAWGATICALASVVMQLAGRWLTRAV